MHNHEGEKYRLITKLPLIGLSFECEFQKNVIESVCCLGEMTSFLVIHTDDRPKKFMYSVDSWLLETNSIELKDIPNTVNSTRIEWTVYTRRRSILFQVSSGILSIPLK